MSIETCVDWYIQDLQSNAYIKIVQIVLLTLHVIVFRHILDMSEFPFIYVPCKSKLC